MCQECWDLLEKEAIKKKLPPVSYIRDKYQPSRVRRLLKHRKNSIERTYGISVARVKELMKEQKNQCPICEQPISFQKRDYAIDHDHTTGKVRGILCGTCNKQLGTVENFYFPNKFNILSYLVGSQREALLNQVIQEDMAK